MSLNSMTELDQAHISSQVEHCTSCLTSMRTALWVEMARTWFEHIEFFASADPSGQGLDSPGGTRRFRFCHDWIGHKNHGIRFLRIFQCPRRAIKTATSRAVTNLCCTLLVLFLNPSYSEPFFSDHSYLAAPFVRNVFTV